MSVAAVEPRGAVREIPDGIESPRAKLVYVALATTDRATVDELAEALGMRKLALFSVLGTLDGRGLVEADGGAYRLA